MTTVEEPKQYASEENHWYSLIDGSPCYEQPCKSRPGEFRKTTLKDAKKLGYLAPSVTEVLKSTHKPMLEQWKLQQVVKACIERPFIGGEDEKEYASYIIEASKEKTRDSASRGKWVHAGIENMLCTGEIVSAYDRAASEAMDSLGLNWSISSSEKSFACPEGYGGKVDLHCNVLFNRFVVDFKTKDDWEDESKLGYDENVMQLAAYANGLGMIQEAQPWPRLISVFISREVPGKWAVKEWNEEDGVLALKKFRLLLEYWFLDKNYRPSIPEL